MTITYQKHVSNTSFMGFAKLLFKWRGSIYKLVFKELLIYGAAFAIISIAYRRYMTEDQRRVFEKVSLYCNQTAGLIPLSFVLGFYVTFVVTRWWNQFVNLPWPDRVMHAVIMYVNGTDERGRLLRRTLIRYVNLATVVLFQSISASVLKRFPTMKHVVDAGLMTAEEKVVFESVKLAVNKHWVPLVWFVNLVNVAVKEGRVQPGAPVKHLLEEINALRTKTGHLWGHDWVTVPLVYTQVVTLLTHLFLITCLIGRQYLDPAQGYNGHEIDLYFPFFTFIQFFFFLGWLKVAEQLINPFGEDDDDFETNWIIDRNMQVCYTAVDDMYGKLPKLERDIHWGCAHLDLPYTEAALVHRIPTYKGSTMHMVVPPREQAVVFSSSSEEPVPERCEHLNSFLSRYCWCCPMPCVPPLNKPLGESYGRPDPLEYDGYDLNGRKESTYSIFGDSYSSIFSRGSRKGSLARRDSSSVRGSVDYTLVNVGDGLPNNPLGPAGPNRRRRPSAVTTQLSSVSENDMEEQEENGTGVGNGNARSAGPLTNAPLNMDAVRAALTFLDEDLEDEEEGEEEVSTHK